MWYRRISFHAQLKRDDRSLLSLTIWSPLMQRGRQSIGQARTVGLVPWKISFNLTFLQKKAERKVPLSGINHSIIDWHHVPPRSVGATSVCITSSRWTRAIDGCFRNVFDVSSYNYLFVGAVHPRERQVHGTGEKFFRPLQWRKMINGRLSLWWPGILRIMTKISRY